MEIMVHLYSDYACSLHILRRHVRRIFILNLNFTLRNTCPSIDPPFKKDFDENGFMKSETTEKTRKKREETNKKRRMIEEFISLQEINKVKVKLKNPLYS